MGEAPSELFIGVMSGTSLDGVDALLADFRNAIPQTLATHYLAYPPELRDRLLALHEPSEGELRRAAELSNELARLYFHAINALLEKAGADAGAIRAIGCHGQTIRHQPAAGYSIQLNSPALLAELTRIAVVADFRSRDIAAGGQGAPLVPAFHEAAFRNPVVRRAILNIGGISNLTLLYPDQPANGFDCGPGNLLMDAWAQRNLGHPFDAAGRWAASGRLLPDLLEKLLGHPFLAARPPKSCGREEFNLRWLEAHLAPNSAPEDVQATLLELTARAIVEVLCRQGKAPAQLFTCGGGTHNTTLIERLRQLLPGTEVNSTLTCGIDPDWVESLAFAWLARQTLSGKPGNLPQVTGAAGYRVLGALYPA